MVPVEVMIFATKMPVKGPVSFLPRGCSMMSEAQAQCFRSLAYIHFVAETA